MSAVDSAKGLVFTGGTIPTGGATSGDLEAETSARELADDELKALADAGDQVRLSYVSGDGQDATFVVVAAQAALTLGVGQLLQFAWQGANTASDPMLTIGSTAYTLRAADGSDLAAGDLRAASYVARIHSGSVIRMLNLVRVADVPGLASTLSAHADSDAALLNLASAGDQVRLSYVSGDGQDATFDVVAAQAALTLGVGQLLQFAWQGANTASDPMLTIGSTAYTLRAADGSDLAAGDLLAASYVARIHSGSVIRMLNLVRVADVPGLGAALSANQMDAAEALNEALDAQSAAAVADAKAVAAQSDVDAEEILRAALINGTATGKFAILDDAGFVIGYISPAGIELMGAVTLDTLDEAGLTIIDDAGFVILRADTSLLSWMGQQIGGDAAVTASLPEARRSLDSVLRPETRSLTGWRNARARGIQGTGRGRVLFLGDSNTAGHSALGAGVHNRRLSTPDTLARMLPAAYGATRGNITGSMIVGNGTDPAYDPRFSLGSGWGASGPVTVGGTMWQNSTTTAEMTFAPDEAWDTADVWVALDSAAGLQIGVTGTMQAYTPGTGSIVKLTYTAPSLAAQTLRIARASGTVRVIAWDCYTAGEGISIINAGRSGSRSDQIADDADWYGPLPAAVALAPDLAVIQIGLNDIAQGIDPAVYQSNVEALTDAMLGAGADVLLTVPMHPSEPRAYPWADYVAAIYAVAEARGLPVVDISNRLGTWPVSDAAGWQSDTLHPNATGYAESAILHLNLLTM